MLWQKLQIILKHEVEDNSSLPFGHRWWKQQTLLAHTTFNFVLQGFLFFFSPNKFILTLHLEKTVIQNH